MVAAAVSLTRLWLSMTWCSRMMKSAEVLMTEPSDRTSTSEPARAWNEEHSGQTDRQTEGQTARQKLKSETYKIRHKEAD